MSNTKALAAALALGFGAAVWTAPANAALDEEALAAVEAPEVAQVAVGVAAVLYGMAPDADEQAIAAAVHGYLSGSVFSEDVILSGLEVVLGGDWTDMQVAALRSLFSRYVAGDIEAPRGGAEALSIEGGAAVQPASDRLEVLTPDGDAPSGGVLSTQAVTDGESVTPPPAPSGPGGSDYSL